MKTKEEIELAARDEFKLKLPFTGDPIAEMAFLESIRQAFIVGALWMQEQSGEQLPSDAEVENWYSENIDAGCSASSGIYKFRQWLKERQPKPILTLEQCKDKIAKEKHAADGWDRFLMWMKDYRVTQEEAVDEMNIAFKQINELYLKSNKGCSDDKWVSVEESWPLETGMYLVWMSTEYTIPHMELKWYDSVGKFEGDGRYLKIISWMPLPTPPNREIAINCLKSLTENKQP